MKLPFNIDLKDKVCVVTGGAGVLCGAFFDLQLPVAKISKVAWFTFRKNYDIL